MYCKLIKNMHLEQTNSHWSNRTNPDFPISKQCQYLRARKVTNVHSIVATTTTFLAAPLQPYVFKWLWIPLTRSNCFTRGSYYQAQAEMDSESSTYTSKLHGHRGLTKHTLHIPILSINPKIKRKKHFIQSMSIYCCLYTVISDPWHLTPDTWHSHNTVKPYENQCCCAWAGDSSLN